MEKIVNSIPVHNIELKDESKRLHFLERFFFTHRNKIQWMHGLMFLMFVCVLFIPLFLPEPPENALPWNDFTVFSNFLMWGVWFPLVFLSVIFTGRSWCGIFCPMGAASEQINKIGLKITTPAIIKWEGMPIVAFLIITFLGQTVGVRDHKEAMAYLFGGLMLAAILVGFVYGKKGRVWCRHMCPIGLLLGLYSRLGIVNFHPKIPKEGGDTYRENSVCPTMIDVLRKKESRHCIECFKCVNPDSKKTVVVSYRNAGDEVENIQSHNPSSAEVWFFFIGTGAALGGFLWLILPFYQTFRQAVGEWAIDKGWYWVGDAGPAWLMSVHPERREVFNWLDFSTIVAFMTLVTVIFTLVIALITYLQSSFIKKNIRQKSGESVFNIVAYQYMPVAMISLLIGLGGKLFVLLSVLGLAPILVASLKAILFVLGILWSARISSRLIANLGLIGYRKNVAVVIGTFGSALIALSWWPAVFGV